VVLCTVSMCGLVALAVDIGLIALAKTQLQNAVDSAAVAGARSLDGTSTQNLGSVGSPNTAEDNAFQMMQLNKVLTDIVATAPVVVNSPANVTVGDVTKNNFSLVYGAWHYDTANQLFVPQFPPQAPDNFNLCQVSATYQVQTAFAGAF